MHLGAEIKFKSAMHLEAMIERVSGCMEDKSKLNSEMHLEAAIEQVWRCTLRP